MRKAYKFDNKYHCAMVTLCLLEHPEMFKIEVITPPKRVQGPELNMDVDCEENLIAIREIFKNVKKDDNSFVIVEDAIYYLDKHPHLIHLLDEGRKPAEARIWD